MMKILFLINYLGKPNSYFQTYKGVSRIKPSLIDRSIVYNTFQTDRGITHFTPLPLGEG